MLSFQSLRTSFSFLLSPLNSGNYSGSLSYVYQHGELVCSRTPNLGRITVISRKTGGEEKPIQTFMTWAGLKLVIPAVHSV